ncbi:hydroxysteroid dehydrogenase-like protein 1 [Phymastichus coffea]|uniref:hydroxysteroid dehydrogenase-like protein 1 n=1 Tax=Phymastichus coffea TaxID=108790 RepID=UPI00273ACD0F|nr:hydroxysteroid dehydrogenase-like protein 1 [Phymastichus coffea]
MSISKSGDLKKRFGDWAVVTGATDGIGKEYAKEFAKRDMNLILISRSMEKLCKTKDELQLLNFNIRIKVIEVDFSRGKFEYEKIRNQLKDIPVGILINNVGALSEYPMYFGETSESNLWEMINVNIGAPTFMTHLIIEDMKTRKKGAIVNICSSLDTYPSPLLSVYAATKTYVRYFTDALREEYSKYGIMIQRLSPYYVNTKMVAYCQLVKKSSTLFPTAATYVKNAIEIIGKLNSGSGYWIHDVIKFFVSFLPMVLKKKIIFAHTNAERNAYLKLLQSKVIEE